MVSQTNYHLVTYPIHIKPIQGQSNKSKYGNTIYIVTILVSIINMLIIVPIYNITTTYMLMSRILFDT